MLPLRAAPRLVVLALALVLTVLAPPGGAAPPGDEGPAVPPVLGAIPDGLAWAEGLDGGTPVVAGVDHARRWDLSALDPDAVRSDVVTVELADVRGPGALAVRAPSPFGEPEVVLASGPGPHRAALQVGRQGTLSWRFAAPGAYEVDLVATVPAQGGGVVRVEATYRIGVDGGGGIGGEGAPSSPSAPVAPSPSPRAPRPAPDGPGGDGPGGAPAPEDPTGGGAPGGAEAGPRAAQVVIDRGHVDMGPRVVDGAWRVQLRDDTVAPPAWRDLADVVLHARDAARLEVPAGDSYGFLGPAGSTVWVLPQVQEADLVWPGWNTQDPSVLAAVPGPVTWRLKGVDGPGRFVLYLAGSFGETDVLFDTADALPQQLVVGRNTHVHGNWAFSAPGVYRLSVEMSATSGSGAALTDTRTLTVAVGDSTDPSAAFTSDPGGTGTPVPPSPGGAGPSDPDGSMGITVDAGPSGPGEPGRGGGPLAATGAVALGVPVVAGLVLVVVGGAVLAGGRGRRRNSIETHS